MRVSSGAIKKKRVGQTEFLEQYLATLRNDLNTKHTKLHALRLELGNVEKSQTFCLFESEHRKSMTKTVDKQRVKKRRQRIKATVKKILTDPITFNAAIDYIASAVPKSINEAVATRENCYNIFRSKDFLMDDSKSNDDTLQHRVEETEPRVSSSSALTSVYSGARCLVSYVVRVRSADGRELKINLARTADYKFDSLLAYVCHYWGVEDDQYMLQTKYSLPVPLKQNCLDWLQHLAISARVLHRQRPRYIGPREAFQVIDDDKSGQVGVAEFSMLFKRLSSRAKMQAPYVFAAIDKDDSGEVTYAEFAQEWDIIYDVLQNDIKWDELPVVYLLPRRVHLIDKGKHGTHTQFNIGNGGGSDQPLGTLVKPVGLNLSPLLAFEMFDTEQAGSIGIQEFQNVFNRLNTDLEQQLEFKSELRELFNETNTSHSGRIDFGEFQQNFTKILDSMAEHSRLFDRTEVLGELGDALGKSQTAYLQQRPKKLPEEAARLVRGIFGYLVFVVLLTFSLISRIDLNSGYYYTQSIRAIGLDYHFGGVLWMSSYAGNNPYALSSSFSAQTNASSNISNVKVVVSPRNKVQAKAFISALDSNSDGQISDEEMKKTILSEYWRSTHEYNILLKQFQFALSRSTDFSAVDIIRHFPRVAFVNAEQPVCDVSAGRKSFGTISNVDSIWRWLRHSLRHAIIQDRSKVYPTGSTVPQVQKSSRLYNEKFTFGRTDRYNNSYSLYSNRIVGSLTLTKVEYRNVRCPPFRSASGAKYQPSECVEENSKPALIRIPHSTTHAYHTKILELVEGKWLQDDRLAKLSLDGVLYNPSVNKFMKFLFEIKRTPSGAYSRKSKFEQIKVDQLVTEKGRVNFSMFILGTLYALYMIADQVSWYKRRQAYGHSFWSIVKSYFTSVYLILQSAIIFLQVVSSCLRLIYYLTPERLEFTILREDTPEFRFLSLYWSIVLCDTLSTSFSWVRIAHYLKISQVITFMSDVLFEVSKRAVPYLLVFLSVIFGFNAFACTVFGPQVMSFSSWPRSLVSLLQMVFEKVEMDEAIQVDPLMSGLFLGIYYVMVVLIMRNIFVAIFIDGYRAAAERYERTPPPLIQWSLQGILGAVIKSLEPQDLIRPDDSVIALASVGQTMANRLKRVDIKIVKDLAKLTDRDISLAVSRTAFIGKESLEKLREEAILLVQAYHDQKLKKLHDDPLEAAGGIIEVTPEEESAARPEGKKAGASTEEKIKNEENPRVIQGKYNVGDDGNKTASL
jgi:Ca2+-binding EF-hand superfamily protein